jgi:hypothetical protein
VFIRVIRAFVRNFCNFFHFFSVLSNAKRQFSPYIGMEAFMTRDDAGHSKMIEHWDRSRKKARELRLEQWGTPEEIQAMAAPLRQAHNRRTAMDCLKEIASNSPFTSKSGLSARLPMRSLGKIVSHAAVAVSFCPQAHYLAAANIDKLYSNAIEPWAFELNPNKDNTGLKARRYLYAPMEYGEKIAVVKITVKEYTDADLQNKLYSIEAVDVDLRAP